MILFYDGFDDQSDSTILQVWSSRFSGAVTAGAGRFVGTNGFRSGTVFTGSAANSNLIKNLPSNVDSTMEFFAQIGARVNTFGAGEIVGILHLYDANTLLQFKIELRSDGSFAFYRWTGDYAFVGYLLMYVTAPDTMQASAYRTLEFRIRLSPTAGIVEMHIDNASVPLILQSGAVATLTAVASTTNGPSGPPLAVSRVGISGNTASAPTMVMDFDDPIFWNNVAGTYAEDPVSWLGDVRCQTLFPNAAGASSGMTASPAVANYLNVDETVPDGDTTYNYTSTVGVEDLYEMTNLVGSVVSIVSVAVCKTVRKDDGTVRTASALVKSGATTTALAAKTVPTTYYQDFTNTIRNPTTVLLYTPAEVDAVQIGTRIIV